MDARRNGTWEEDLECLSEPADGMDHVDSDSNDEMPPLLDYESSVPASAEYTSDEDEWHTADTGVPPACCTVSLQSAAGFPQPHGSLVHYTLHCRHQYAASGTYTR